MTYQKPAEIEARSMAIITEELQKKGICLPADTASVIRRVIHTTADFDFANNMHFSQGAAGAAITALRNGTDVVTDTNMAAAGIARAGLERLGGQVYCYMADQAVAEQAKERETTRAVCAMQKAAQLHPGAIYAIGNAPTALFALSALIREGMRPALVIGVPVGFVNVAEAKEELVGCCNQAGVPVIAAMGRKGGSTVAAAICNALIYKAAGMEDPAGR
ncbi:MAG: precorrin-8X methylmutase [Lachnospiraceae bacterium]|nr:precorrin-8X methylmutase [Lachnospiraceae bacterium]